jgi:hypothetical protein
MSYLSVASELVFWVRPDKDGLSNGVKRLEVVFHGESPSSSSGVMPQMKWREIIACKNGG